MRIEEGRQEEPYDYKNAASMGKQQRIIPLVFSLMILALCFGLLVWAVETSAFTGKKEQTRMITEKPSGAVTICVGGKQALVVGVGEPSSITYIRQILWDIDTHGKPIRCETK